MKLIIEHLAIGRPRSSILPPPVERSPLPAAAAHLPTRHCSRRRFHLLLCLCLCRAHRRAAAASKEDDDVSRAVDVAYISRKAGRGENGTLMSAHSAVLDASFDISLSIFGKYLFEYSPRQRSGVFCFIQAFCNSSSLYRTQSP